MSRHSDRLDKPHPRRRRRIPEVAIAILLAILLALFLLGRMRGSFSSPAPAHLKPASLDQRHASLRKLNV